MPHPLYNGGLVGALDEQNRPYIADDGNWSMQGASENPAYRSVQLLVNGLEAFGFYPDWQREAFEQALARQGCFLRADALAWRGPALAAGQTFEIKLKAGNRHYYGAQGDDPGDYMEWGSGDPRDASRELVATTGVISVPGNGGNVPAPDDVTAQLAEMADNVRAEQALMSAKDPEAWISQNPGEANEVLRVVVYAAFGRQREAKQLKTHAGRAASGIAQNGATSMRL